MNAKSTAPISDLMLICETDVESAAILQRVADRLGCDHVEVDGANALRELLDMRQPTLAVLAVDGSEADGLKLLQILSEHDVRPATLLVGNQDERVLAGVQRIAAARGYR